MNARAHSFGRNRAAEPSPAGQLQPATVSMHWPAILDAAEIVAVLAGVPSDNGQPDVRNFPARLQREADRCRHEQATHGIADLKAVLEPGLTALLAINARGGNPAVAAQALWREFIAARSAMLGLLPPNGRMGPRRSA